MDILPFQKWIFFFGLIISYIIYRAYTAYARAKWQYFTWGSNKSLKMLSMEFGGRHISKDRGSVNYLSMDHFQWSVSVPVSPPEPPCARGTFPPPGWGTTASAPCPSACWSQSIWTKFTSRTGYLKNIMDIPYLDTDIFSSANQYENLPHYMDHQLHTDTAFFPVSWSFDLFRTFVYIE